MVLLIEEAGSSMDQGRSGSWGSSMMDDRARTRSGSGVPLSMVCSVLYGWAGGVDWM